MYQKALAKLDLALARYHQMGDDPKAKSRRLKLNRVRQQIQFRLQEHKVPGASSRPQEWEFLSNNNRLAKEDPFINSSII